MSGHAGEPCPDVLPFSLLLLSQSFGAVFVVLLQVFMAVAASPSPVVLLRRLVFLLSALPLLLLA